MDDPVRSGDAEPFLNGRGQSPPPSAAGVPWRSSTSRRPLMGPCTPSLFIQSENPPSMASSFAGSVCDALVFGVKDSDTRRRVKLLCLMLIYGHCYILIYRSAVAGQIYFDGRRTSPSFWYSILGALGAGTVFHLIDEGCCRLTRHNGPLPCHHEQTDSDLESDTSNSAPSPVGDDGHASHRPPPHQPAQSVNNPIQQPANDTAPLSPIPSKPNISIEMLRTLRMSIDTPCHKVIPKALRQYGINDDWRRYDLYILFGDHDRRLGLEEKPSVVIKQLDREVKRPVLMLRRNLWSDPSAVAGQESGRQETEAAAARRSTDDLK
ncbi:MAG: hypothetical protein Q9184_001427 [Pyrenodesmia sp. 2 TL-2023]